MLENSSIKNLDHLGIIAGIIDDLEIEKIVNERLGINQKEKITAGQIVKAIIINGLGFVSAPLYLFPQFFQDKPVEKLLGEGIKAEYINDDKIGRVMDELWNYGLEKIWTHLAINTIKKYQIQEGYLHLDSTSISVKGNYLKSKDSEETITVTYGYSQDKRPDLKQFMIDLIVSNDGDIPLLIKVGSGNQSDKKMFTERIKEYQENINQENKEITYIADSALYTAENLQKLKQIKWISRVPITIKKAKELLEIKEEKNWIISEKVGYSYQEHKVNYQGIEQRWLIVLSEARKESDLKKLNKNREKEEQTIQEQIKKWTTRKKKSLEELEQEIKAFKKKLLFYELKVIDYKKELNSQK
jgi:transposase